MTDKEIIALIRSGQTETAFNAIVGNYNERLYWHVRHFLCSHEDTDDLLQEIFIKVWSGLQNFRGESGIYTWLFRIATNESLNFLQKCRIRSILRFGSLTDEMAQKIESDPYFNGDEIERELEKAIHRLPDKQKTVFLMRYREDLPYEDISEILGTSVGALKASYHFAKEKILQELDIKNKNIKLDRKKIVKELLDD
ncbi:MAG: RNA polymerase sigma factor [Bacteroidales bacterium]|nr:RNA polymerase sigma factor [Bacteroidales bacterium]